MSYLNICFPYRFEDYPDLEFENLEEFPKMQDIPDKGEFTVCFISFMYRSQS